MEKKTSIICKLGVLKSSKMRIKHRDAPGLNRVFMMCAGTSLRLQQWRTNSRNSSVF